MGLFGSVKKFKGQDYHALKKESKKKGTLFIDTEFPPDDRSLSSTPGKFGGVVWKRPKVEMLYITTLYSMLTAIQCSLLPDDGPLSSTPGNCLETTKGRGAVYSYQYKSNTVFPPSQKQTTALHTWELSGNNRR